MRKKHIRKLYLGRKEFYGVNNHMWLDMFDYF